MFCASFTVASDRNLDPGAIQAINAVLIIQNVGVILTVQSLCAKQLTTCQKKYNNLMEVFTYLNGRTSSGIEIESKRYLDSFKFRISYIMLGASDVPCAIVRWIMHELRLQEITSLSSEALGKAWHSPLFQNYPYIGGTN